MRLRSLACALAAVIGVAAATPAPALGASWAVSTPLQGFQTNESYIASYAKQRVQNVFATSQKTSCYTPEVPYFTSDSPNNGYTGMTACSGTPDSGEATGPYPTQNGSKPGYPAAAPMLVKDHSESDLRVDPLDPRHLIGSSKWLVSAEGYNHLLGFYESFDGGTSWSVQGHIPGYEGWTDNTDPIGAFDGFGNYYSFVLGYQFSYDATGHHDFSIGALPNPSLPAEVVGVAVRPHGATAASEWSTSTGGTDLIASYQSVGGAPDKQWIAIDSNPKSPNYNQIYAMWVVFDGPYGSKPFFSTAKALEGGTHTPWSAPQLLPNVNGTSADTYLLPHVDPSGTVWTSVTNFPSAQQRSTYNISVDYSTDGGMTWHGPLAATGDITQGPFIYPNTTYRFGIADSFAVGNQLTSKGAYPLYVVYEDYSAGFANEMLTMSADGGATWSPVIQVNDNDSPAEEHQGNLAVAANGTVMVNFYDRRLPCPLQGSKEAIGAGLSLDTYNPNYSGSVYGAANYCVNASMQFYRPDLTPIGQNIRLSQHSFDPQLNSPHPGCATCRTTFIGDYFGNTSAGGTSFSSFVSTFDPGVNPGHYQQQVVATLRVP